MPAGERAPRVPLDLGVVVGMEVHEARRHDQPAGVEDLRGVAGSDPADLGDAPVLNPDVGAVAGYPETVDHRAALDQNVKVSHWLFPSLQ